MPAREINPFTALTRILSQFLRTQWSTSNHSEWTRLRIRPLSHRGWLGLLGNNIRILVIPNYKCMGFSKFRMLLPSIPCTHAYFAESHCLWKILNKPNLTWRHEAARKTHEKSRKQIGSKPIIIKILCPTAHRTFLTCLPARETSIINKNKTFIIYFTFFFLRRFCVNHFFFV